jgi:sulfate adenylyltransferase subunit 1 (EFTu-like GTPase family)
VGDRITVWPSGRSARVNRIATFDGDLDFAFAPMSVTLTLDDEVDISRGDVLTAVDSPQAEPPTVGTEFEADVVWMDERPLDPGRVYLIKQATKTVTAEIHHGLVLNQIGTVNVSTARPLVFDRYVENRATGSFVIIDPATHFTAGAGMISNPLTHTVRSVNAPISAAERLALLARHAGSDAEAVEAIRKALEELLA